MVRQSLSAALHCCIRERWNKDDYSDFTVVVEDAEFKCHRFILASCSTFFSLMFRNDMSETLSKKAVLQNIRKETFTIIINAIYLGEFDLTLDNVVEVWYAVHMLDIQFLLKECEDFISPNLNLENYVKFFQHSRFLNSKNVILSTHKFIVENFDHFKETETFLHISYKTFLELVKDYNLNVSSEDSMIDAILEWTTFNSASSTLCEIIDRFDVITVGDFIEDILPDKTSKYSKTTNFSLQDNVSSEDVVRKQYLPSLLSAARICVASESYLENLLNNPMVIADASAIRLVKNALLCHWKPKCGITPLVYYRKYHNMCNVVSFVIDRQICFYFLEEKLMISVFTLPNKGYNNLCIAANEEGLILSRSDGTKVIYELFVGYCCMLNRLAETKTECCFPFLCHQRNILIINTNKPIETNLDRDDNPYGLICYSVFKDWPDETIPNHAIIYKDNIIVFSLSSRRREIDVCLIKLDKSDRKIIKVIPGLSDCIATFQAHDNSYVLQGDGNLWLIAANSESGGVEMVHISTLWDFKWSLCGAAWYWGTLFLFGKRPVDISKLYLLSQPDVFDKVEVVVKDFQTKTVCLVVSKEQFGI